MRFYLIGSRGRLGRAIASEYDASRIVAPQRAVYEGWAAPNNAAAVSRFLDSHAAGAATIFVAAGLLDPKLERNELVGVNYHLPRNIIEGATRLGLRVITFGTIMERRRNVANAYIQSKIMLSDYVDEAADSGRNVLHIQIHTLYGGGPPSPFMFLGQMLSALQADAPFRMTSGKQLREYHHVTDEAKAIGQLATSRQTGVMSINHGRPLRLRDIAENVFRDLGRAELLHVGSLPEPSEENYQEAFPPTKFSPPVDFRDSLPAIVGYMKSQFSSGEARV